MAEINFLPVFLLYCAYTVICVYAISLPPIMGFIESSLGIKSNNQGESSKNSFVPQRIQSTISEVDKGTLDFLNREPSDRVLDLEEKFMKELPADSSFIDSVHIIFPGTRWCGLKDQAESDSDLGTLKDTDSCCRNHKRCTENISPGEEKYGLKNSGSIIRSECDCDQKFKDCLKEAKTLAARSIGYTYFTVLGPQCYTYDYPIIKCEERNSKRCVKYIRDETQPKIWQWVDNDLF